MDSILSRLSIATRPNRRARRAFPQLSLTRLEDRTVPTADVWTGASSNLWSDAGNWTLGAPTAGEDLDFPSNATNKTSVYDSGLGVSSFGTIAIDGSGYDISASFAGSLTLTSGISTTYGSSISNFDIGFDPGNGAVSVGTGGTLELGGVIAGTSGLAVSGGGTLQLGGTSSNTYTGTTTVANVTTLVLDKSSATAVPGSLSISAGGTVQLAQSDQIADASSVSAGTLAILNLNNFSDTIGSLTLTGATVATGTGTLTLGGNVTTNSDSNTSVISGNLDLGGATRTFTVANNAQLDPDLSITANISGTGAGLIKAGANSQLRLSGNNTYDGTTTIAAGAIEIASDNALGASSAGTVVNSGFSLALLGGITVAEPITINGAGFGGLGAVFNGNGNNTISGAITLGANSTIGSLSGTLTFSGAISDGASSFALTKVGAGTVALTSANTYDGGTTITNGLNGGGVLAISNGSALGTGSVSISNGNELDLSNDITLSRNISFQGTGVGGNGALRSVSGNNTYSGTASVQANNTRIKVDAGQLTLSGDLTDGNNSYSAEKYGAGVLLVTGSLTSTLTLHAIEGDLRVDGSDTSVVTLYGGTVSGTGTVGVLNQAGGSPGTVNPGTGGGTIGTFTTTGGYQVGTGGTTHIDIGGTTAGTGYDQVVNTTSGSVDITGSAIDPTLVGGFVPAVGDVFTVIDKQNSGAVTGTFLNLAEGATFKSGVVTYQVSYVGGNGNDVTLTAVAVTYTWTGLGGDGNWSTAANWDTNMAPAGGEDLVFPSGAARLSNTNDLSGKSFHSITISGGGYDINGNAITLTNGISDSDASNTSEIHLNVALTATETVDVVAGGDLILSGALSGSGFGITETGGGTLEYTGFSANTYTGTTTVDAGTLIVNRASGLNAIAGDLVIGDNSTGGQLVQLQSNNQIADGSSVTVNEGASFDVGTSSETFATLALQGGATTIGSGGVLTLTSGLTTTAATGHTLATVSGAGALDLNSSGSFAITVADDPTLPVDARISTVIQNGGITKSGTGVLALSGANTYAGATAVSAGALQVESDAALGTAAGGTTVAGGASVFFTGPRNVAENFSIAGTGAGALGALYGTSGSTALTGTVTLTANSQIGAANGSALTISGDISESGGARNLSIVQGTATGLTALGGTNTYSGGTTVASGTVQITNPAALGTGTVTVGDGTATAGHLEIDLTGTNTVANTFAFNAPITTGLQVNSGTTTFTGGTTLNSDLGINESTGTSLKFAGDIGDGGQTKGVTKDGTGTLIFAAINIYTGTTFVDQGLLQLNASGVSVAGNVTVSGPGTAATVEELQGNQIADGATVNLANAGATLDLNGFDDTIASLSLTGSAVTTGAGTLTVHAAGGITTLASSQTATLSGRLAFDAANNFFTVAQGTTASGIDLSVSAVVSSFANIIKAGAGTMAFSGANTYSGGTNINAGVLAISTDTGAGTGVVNIQGTGTLDLSGGIAVANTLNVDSSGTAVRNSGGANTISGAFNLGVDATIDTAASTTLSISSVVNDSSNGYGLTKTSAGTLELDAANTYSGATTVSAGTLRVNGSIAASTGVTVASGATLGGSGTAPAVTVSSAGTLAPGNSPGVLHTGALAFVSGATYSVALDGTTVGTQYDQTAVTGTVTLAGATLSPSLGYTPAIGGTFEIISNDGADPVSGGFNGLAEGATLTLGSVTLRISYVGGDGNDVTLTRVATTATTTTVTASVANPAPGQPVTYTAVVAASSGTATGSVDFYNATTGAFLGTAGLDGNGAAQLATSALTAGPNLIRAVYSGEGNFFASSGGVTTRVVRVPLYAAGSAAGGPGVVTIYNGSGAAREQFQPFGAYAGGVKVAVGDVNGDGYSDVIVVAGPGTLNGLVGIYSGKDFSLLSTYFAFPGYQGAFNVAAGDLTGSGVADVIFSTATGGDFVFAYAGASNTFIVPVFSAFDGFTGGVTIAAGDVLGTGRDQIIVGTASRLGAAGVFNSGGQLVQLYFAPIAINGVNVAAGDVNGDGRADVILGAKDSTLVLVYDGASQQLANYFFAYPGQPGVTVATVDRDGDGKADIITGFTSDTNAFGIYSGESFTLIDVGLSPSGFFGLNVAGSGTA
ncbi:autotransporter-associated beta strand repeat-containing protein [Frigoriglobus tundricola]|nr:autotransporter-associated beta strand repeat-containing protein [Frigoriglobus tundricola]